MATGKIVQKKPFIVAETPGRKVWCACGLSSTQPYCDESHRTTECRPVAVELTEAKKVAWCGCKQTKSPPFCDGTHRTL
jgi:CDGSH-type Zn-finger protein